MENRENMQRGDLSPEARKLGSVEAHKSENQRDADEAVEPSFRHWVAGNGFSLVVVGAALIYVFMKFDAEGMWAILKVVKVDV